MRISNRNRQATVLWLLVLFGLFLWIADLSLDELAKSPAWYVPAEMAP